eukprot:6612654-Prymnesium_polylepis.1
MLRVMYVIVPATRDLGRTFLATYRSSFDPALRKPLFECLVAQAGARFGDSSADADGADSRAPRTALQCAAPKVPIFDTKKFPLVVVLHLLHKLEPMVGTPGQLVVQQGKANRKLHIIERGSVRVWKNYDDKDNRIMLRQLADNDFFGERSILAAWEKGEKNEPATATCECY